MKEVPKNNGFEEDEEDEEDEVDLDDEFEDIEEDFGENDNFVSE